MNYVCGKTSVCCGAASTCELRAAGDVSTAAPGRAIDSAAVGVDPVAAERAVGVGGDVDGPTLAGLACLDLRILFVGVCMDASTAGRTSATCYGESDLNVINEQNSLNILGIRPANVMLIRLPTR